MAAVLDSLFSRTLSPFAGVVSAVSVFVVASPPLISSVVDRRGVERFRRIKTTGGVGVLVEHTLLSKPSTESVGGVGIVSNTFRSHGGIYQRPYQQGGDKVHLCGGCGYCDNHCFSIHTLCENASIRHHRGGRSGVVVPT